MAKVACIPVSTFYSQGQDRKLLRFCFAKEEAELQEALHRLKNLSPIFGK
jgi:methionine aminotransferase